MNKKVLIVLVFVGLSALAAFFAYKYIYHSEHRNVASETASITINAKVIVNQFQSNSYQANTNFLDKVVVVTGSVSALDRKNVILDAAVNCVMIVPVNPKLNQKLAIKGRVVGYDDFLGEVKLDQCIIIQ